MCRAEGLARVQATAKRGRCSRHRDVCGCRKKSGRTVCCDRTLSRDVTQQKEAESLQAGQQAVLEMVATGRPLADVLEAVCRLIEEQDPGLFCLYLLPDEMGEASGRQAAKTGKGRRISVILRAVQL